MIESSMTRRGFLGTSLAVGLSATVLRAEEKFGPFKMGAQTYTWRNFPLERALAEMQQLGLNYAEFATGHVPLDSSDEQIEAVLRLCKAHGITPAAAGVFPFSSNTDANRKVFDFGQKLGVRVLSADPSPDAFDSLDKLCDEYKIAIAIHPHGPGGNKLHHWYSAEIIMAAVKDHHPLIGSCLDTGHLIRCAQPPFGKKLDPAEQILVMGPRNFGIHMKDHDNQTREDVIYGKGSLDVASVLKALRAVNFKGAISVEYEAHADNPTPDVRDCLVVVEEAVAGLSEKS